MFFFIMVSKPIRKYIVNYIHFVLLNIPSVIFKTEFKEYFINILCCSLTAKVK